MIKYLIKNIIPLIICFQGYSQISDSCIFSENGKYVFVFSSHYFEKDIQYYPIFGKLKINKSSFSKYVVKIDNKIFDLKYDSLEFKFNIYKGYTNKSNNNFNRSNEKYNNISDSILVEIDSQFVREGLP